MFCCLSDKTILILRDPKRQHGADCCSRDHVGGYFFSLARWIRPIMDILVKSPPRASPNIKHPSASDSLMRVLYHLIAVENA